MVGLGTFFLFALFCEHGMGPGNLAKFKNMLATLSDEDFETASAEALSLRWATEVGERADRIAERIRTGTY